MSEDPIDVSIEDDKQLPATPDKEIHTTIEEEPQQILGKIADWATKGTELKLSSKDGLRHLLSESRDRSSMFMSVLAMQRMKRIAKLTEAAESVQENLFRPERVAMMETTELIQTAKLIQGMVKENIDFINKSAEDSTTGAQILINMVDARSLTLAREDIPAAKSRESIRHAVSGLLEAFGGKKLPPGSLDVENDGEIIDVE
jgi:hypothetical protein